MRLARDLRGAGALERRSDERFPHAPVEGGELGVGADDGPERAGGGRDRRAPVGDFGDGRLVAEAPESRTDPLQRGAEAPRRTKSRLARELPAEGGSGLAEALRARTFGQ